MRLFLSSVLFIWGSASSAFTLGQAIETALIHNPEWRKTALQREGEEYDLEVTAAQWTPQWQWRSEIDGLTQEAGTTLQMGYQLPWGAQIESRVGQGSESQFLLQVTQPLLKGRGKKSTLAPLFRSTAQYKISEWQRVQQKIELLTQVSVQYRHLQALALQIDIQKQLCEQAHKSLEQIELRIAAGRNPENDKLQAQLEVMRQIQSLNEAERSQEQAVNDFGLLLGRPLEEPIESFSETERVLAALKTYQDYALLHHPQLQQMAIQAEMNDRDQWLAKDALLWDLNVVGQVSSLDRYYGGVNLTVPIGNKKTQRQALVKAHLEREQWEISSRQWQQTVAYTIQNAWQEVQAKERQRSLSLESLKLARASLEAVQQKFNAGRTASFELVLMQQQLKQMELEVISVTLAYYNAFTALEAACGMILESWEPRDV